MNFGLQLGVLRGFLGLGLVSGVPIHQACRNFLPLRALDAPVTDAVALDGIFTSDLERPIGQNQFFPLWEYFFNRSLVWI